MRSSDETTAPPVRRGDTVALVAVCLGSFLFLLDTTVVTVALPEVGRAFGAAVGDLQWVPEVYTLVLAVLMLPAGAIADRYGQRRTFLAGTAVFGIASAACALAPTLTALVCARAAQGVGGAAIAVCGFALLLRGRDERGRGRAIGVYFAVSGLGAAVGPLVGGVLTEYAGWRSVFWVNLPVVLLVLLAGRRVAGDAPAGARTRFDVLGAVLFAVAAAAATVGLGTAAGTGWADPRTWVPLAVAGPALLAFLLRQARTGHGLVDLRLFRNARFSAAMAGAAVSSVVFAASVYTSLWLQDGLGLGPLRTGVALLPLAVAAFVTSTVSGRLVPAVAPQRLLGTGLLLVGAGLALQTGLDVHSGPWSVAAGLAVAGVGVGIAGPAVGRAVADAAPADRTGTAAGLMTTLRQLGQTLGVAVLALPYTAAAQATWAGLDAVNGVAAVAAVLAGLLALATAFGARAR